jgi:hypothetical protein
VLLRLPYLALMSVFTAIRLLPMSDWTAPPRDACQCTDLTKTQRDIYAKLQVPAEVGARHAQVDLGEAVKMFLVESA